jgi:hypothetical protein
MGNLLPVNEAGAVHAEHISGMIHRRCEDMGVSVSFCPRAPTASTNGRHITIPAIRHPITKDKLAITYGYVIHECGHHTRPDAFKILNSAQPPPALSAIYNIAEDDGMEREVASKWKGDRIALGNMNSLLVDEVRESWEPVLTETPDPKAPKRDPAPVATMNIGQLSRTEWDDISTTAIDKLIKSHPKDIQDLTTALVDEGWVERFRATTDEHETWDVAVDLTNRLYPGNEKENEEIRAAGHAMGPPPKRPTKEVKAKTKDQEKEGMVISWEDVVLSEHNEWKPKNGIAGNMGIDWAGHTSSQRGACLMPLKMVNVIDMAKSRADSHKSRQWTAYVGTSKRRQGPKCLDTRSTAG